MRHGTRWRRTHLGTEADRATFRTLHTASLASPALREGLTDGQRRAQHPAPARPARHPGGRAHRHRPALLAWDGPGQHHGDQRAALAGATVDARQHPGRRPRRPGLRRPGLPGPARDRSARWSSTSGSSAPSRSSPRPRPPGLVRAADEVARWVSGQLELAELDASRTRLMEAEVRALRAQISPHFIYNSLGAIASFVRTDPDRARELLLEFADFTRYSFRRHGEFTTLAEELRSVERYLLLEQARFGDRLQVTLRIAPEVLPVAVPFLCLQPLVENAVRHGLEPAGGAGRITIVAARPRPGVRDRGRGRRRRARTRRRYAGPSPATPPSTRSGSATSTSGCATRSATSTGWSSRPPPAPAPR